MVKVKLKIEGRGNFWINWCLPHSFISSMALKLIQAVMKSLINEWKKGFSSHSWQRSFTVPFTNPFSHTHKPTLHNLSPTDLLNLWKHPERDCQVGVPASLHPAALSWQGSWQKASSWSHPGKKAEKWLWVHRNKQRSAYDDPARLTRRHHPARL